MRSRIIVSGCDLTSNEFNHRRQTDISHAPTETNPCARLRLTPQGNGRGKLLKIDAEPATTPRRGLIISSRVCIERSCCDREQELNKLFPERPAGTPVAFHLATSRIPRVPEYRQWNAGMPGNWCMFTPLQQRSVDAGAWESILTHAGCGTCDAPASSLTSLSSRATASRCPDTQIYGACTDKTAQSLASSRALNAPTPNAMRQLASTHKSMLTPSFHLLIGLEQFARDLGDMCHDLLGNLVHMPRPRSCPALRR